MLGPEMPTLGCSCTGSAAYFALMSGDDYVDDPLSRIQVADVLNRGERLIELRESFRVEFERIRPTGVALLGSIARPPSYNVAAECATIETIVRRVAQELELPCERLSPPTVAVRVVEKVHSHSRSLRQQGQPQRQVDQRRREHHMGSDRRL